MRIILMMSLYLLFISGSIQAAQAECQINNRELGAQYQVNTTDNKGKKTSHNMTLYRHQDDVVYQYESQNISEYWHQQHNGLVALTRYFDKEKKGIEYQPNELKSHQSWQQINQFISPSLRHKMQLISTRKSNCSPEQDFVLIQGNNKVLLTWLPLQNLVKTLTIISEDKTKHWQLNNLITSVEQVKLKFTQWQQYETTDYADVGDNEDDPFLAKMINLGFIEHAASGFYQADGTEIHVSH